MKALFVCIQHSNTATAWLQYCQQSNRVQAPSEASQRATLEAVVKVLWRVSAADEEDPDCRAAIEATLHPPKRPSLDPPDEEAPTQAGSGADVDAAPGGGGGSQEAGAQEGATGGGGCGIRWPQLTVETWQQVESMLDVGGGCAVVGSTDFAGWVSSVLQCRPALSRV